MKVFVTGATGYIGGSVAAKLIADGHQVSALVRSEARAAQARDKGINPVIGSLDDTNTLQTAVRASDAVINAASADHRGAVE
ncbi:MAG: NAD(P)H-binding protein, partial [Proteobacteria bacterium]|nr:NAD(P)H-binding protein [Pseudomonadota bacterium]